MTTNPIMNVH